MPDGGAGRGEVCVSTTEEKRAEAIAGEATAPHAMTLRRRRVEHRARWPQRAQRVVAPAALVVALFALIPVLGWVLEEPRLVRLEQDLTSTKFNTAVCLLFISAAFITTRVAVRRGLLVVPLLIAAATLVEHLADIDLGINELVVDDPFTQPPRLPGLMSPTAALALLCLAAGGLASSLRHRAVAQVVLLPPFALGMSALLGYAYGVRELYDFGRLTPMSPPTAAGMVALSLIVLLSIDGGALQRVLFGRDPGAALQRVLIPVAVVVLPVAGWVRVQALENGVPPAAGTAAMVTLAAVTMVGIGVLAGNAAGRIDAERESLIDELNAVNADLEERIRVRSLQLNRQRTKLALLDERDRIARDLHDRVIQRIFAAGLQVASLERTARKEGHGDDALVSGLDTVARELDLAIRELRNSIFELTSIADHDDVEQVIHDVVARASRILGFRPRVTVSGETHGLPSELVAHIATVVQESLSNIARHAQASEAEVTFHADDHSVEVRVSDDGVGMPDPLPRSSGVSNLINRAQDLDGTATWTPREPHGTVMTWRVPRRLEASEETQDLREAQGRPTPLPAAGDATA